MRRDGIYINPCAGAAPTAWRFISFFRIYTQRIEWKENIILRREAFICRFFFYSRFRAQSNKKQEEYMRICGGVVLEKRATHPEMIGFSLKNFTLSSISAEIFPKFPSLYGI
jgi:hypothetical protein